MALYQPRVVIVFMRNVYVWHWFLYSMLSYWSYPWKTTVIIVLHFFFYQHTRKIFSGIQLTLFEKKEMRGEKRTYTKEYTHTQIKKCMSIIRKKYGRVKIIPKGRTSMRTSSTKLKIRVVEGEKRFILKGKREQSEIVLPRGNGGRAPQRYL